MYLNVYTYQIKNTVKEVVLRKKWKNMGYISFQKYVMQN